MQYLPMLLAVVGVILAAGTIGAARAEDDGHQHTATLFTPPLDGDHFTCNAVNVSKKTIGIVITLFDANGRPLVDIGTPPQANPDTFLHVHPGAIVAFEPLQRNPSEGAYCSFELLGTDDPQDVRVQIGIAKKRPSDGVLVFRTLEGH